MPETPRSKRKTQNRVIALCRDEQTAIAAVLTEMDAELAELAELAVLE